MEIFYQICHDIRKLLGVHIIMKSNVHASVYAVLTRLQSINPYGDGHVEY